MNDSHKEPLPRVSVILPVFNGVQYLSSAIDSILNQTFTDFELIIIDDGSIDSTALILSKYQKLDPRIKIISHKLNRGIPESLNQGISAALGDYIARMDADDIMLPWRLKLQVEFMDMNPQVAISDTYMSPFSNQTNLTILKEPKKFAIPQLKQKELVKIKKNIRTYLIFNTCFNHPTLIAKRSILTQNPYPSVPYAEDYLLWMRLSFTTQFARLNQCTVYYRLHAAQSLHKMHTRSQWVTDEIRLPYLLAQLPTIRAQELKLLSAFLNGEMMVQESQVQLYKLLKTPSIFRSKIVWAELALYYSRQEKTSCILFLGALIKAFGVWKKYGLPARGVKEILRTLYHRLRWGIGF